MQRDMVLFPPGLSKLIVMELVDDFGGKGEEMLPRKGKEGLGGP